MKKERTRRGQLFGAVVVLVLALQAIGGGDTSLSLDPLPPTTQNMKDLKVFLFLLERNIAFGFAHYNDGEILAATDCPEGGETDHGWQKCSDKLKVALSNSMINTARNFYLGVPCMCEFMMKSWLASMSLLNITRLSVECDKFAVTKSCKWHCERSMSSSSAKFKFPP